MPHIDSPAAIEDRIAKLTSAFTTSAYASYIPPQNFKNDKSMPWWNDDLHSLRGKARVEFKAWSRNKNPQSELLYRASKATYQRPTTSQTTFPYNLP